MTSFMILLKENVNISETFLIDTDGSENIGKYSFELHLMVSMSLLLNQLFIFKLDCGKK